MNGAYTTTKGRELIAKSLTTEKLTLTKILVGKGKPPDDCDFNTLEDLFDSVAVATSDTPTTDGNAVKLIVEYRNDLDDGLKQGFWLSEFGIFAEDPDVGEVLLFYGTLGENPQYVVAFTGNVDIRRFPVSIPIIGDVEVDTVYSPSATLTADDLKAHNEDPGAHEDLMHPRIQLWVKDDAPTNEGAYLWIFPIKDLNGNVLFEFPEEIEEKTTEEVV